MTADPSLSSCRSTAPLATHSCRPFPPPPLAPPPPPPQQAEGVPRSEDEVALGQRRPPPSTRGGWIRGVHDGGQRSTQARLHLRQQVHAHLRHPLRFPHRRRQHPFHQRLQHPRALVDGRAVTPALHDLPRHRHSESALIGRKPSSMCIYISKICFRPWIDCSKWNLYAYCWRLCAVQLWTKQSQDHAQSCSVLTAM
nr:uncharacterized protein LOC117837681 isoform X2 [Setaria viridis]